MARRPFPPFYPAGRALSTRIAAHDGAWKGDMRSLFLNRETLVTLWALLRPGRPRSGRAVQLETESTDPTIANAPQAQLFLKYEWATLPFASVQ